MFFDFRGKFVQNASKHSEKSYKFARAERVWRAPIVFSCVNLKSLFAQRAGRWVVTCARRVKGTREEHLQSVACRCYITNRPHQFVPRCECFAFASSNALRFTRNITDLHCG
jgi:hypothetical protein